jgi:hypothetical protein
MRFGSALTCGRQEGAGRIAGDEALQRLRVRDDIACILRVNRPGLAGGSNSCGGWSDDEQDDESVFA